MNVITAEEKVRLEQDLSERIAFRRVISERIAEARALGDLRENSEYHAAREDQGMNEAKIREIEDKLAQSHVADAGDMPEGVVFIGATVRLRDEGSGSEDLYRLVGQATNDFSVDYVEVTTTSPMGMALLKSRVGESVLVSLPRGDKRFSILEIVS